MILSHCEEKEERRGRIVGEVGGEKEKRKGKGKRGKEGREGGKKRSKEGGETFQSVLEKKMVSEAICTLATGPLQI